MKLKVKMRGLEGGSVRLRAYLQPFLEEEIGHADLLMVTSQLLAAVLSIDYQRFGHVISVAVDTWRTRDVWVESDSLVQEVTNAAHSE